MQTRRELLRHGDVLRWFKLVLDEVQVRHGDTYRDKHINNKKKTKGKYLKRSEERRVGKEC